MYGCTWRVELQYRRLDGENCTKHFIGQKDVMLNRRNKILYICCGFGTYWLICVVCKASEVCIVSFKDFKGAIGSHSWCLNFFFFFFDRLNYNGFTCHSMHWHKYCNYVWCIDLTVVFTWQCRFLKDILYLMHCRGCIYSWKCMGRSKEKVFFFSFRRIKFVRWKCVRI